MKSGDKIVLILGNGFDLDLGLKTSYKDFWESEYCPKDYPAPIIKHLNEKWEGKTEGVRWYDLENELIYYYDSIKDNKFYPDIITDKEAEYIKNADIGQLQHYYFGNYYQQVNSLFNKGLIKHYGNYNMLGIPYLEDLRHDSVWRDHNAIKLIKQRLCQYISKANEDGPRTSTISYNILKAMRDCREKGTNVSIYSFNYTPLPAPFDRTLGDSTFHVHGSCHDGNVIIGTREYSEYTSDYDFLQKSFDPFFQPPRIVSDLLAADEVIIFGHSLGENDSQYFKAFFIHK